MSGDRPPPDKAPRDWPAGERPTGEREERDPQRRLERLWPELIRRFMEAGYEKLSEGPENLRQFVNELKLPKELLALILTQLEETKYGLYRVVAKEIRDVLEHSNLSDELSRALTQVTLEVKTQVRFVLNDESPRSAPVPKTEAKAAEGQAEPSTPQRENPS